MNSDQAKDVLAHIVAQRVRWGKQYDAGDIGVAKLTEALLVLAQEDSHEAAELRKSLTTANRQLAAAGAREARMKKQADELREHIQALEAVVEKLEAKGLTSSEDDGE